MNMDEETEVCSREKRSAFCHIFQSLNKFYLGGKLFLLYTYVFLSRLCSVGVKKC